MPLEAFLHALLAAGLIYSIYKKISAVALALGKKCARREASAWVGILACGSELRVSRFKVNRGRPVPLDHDRHLYIAIPVRLSPDEIFPRR